MTDIAETLANWNVAWLHSDQHEIIQKARAEIMSMRERLERLSRAEADNRAQLWQARLDLLAAKAAADPTFDHETFLRTKGWI